MTPTVRKKSKPAKRVRKPKDIPGTVTASIYGGKPEIRMTFGSANYCMSLEEISILARFINKFIAWAQAQNGEK